MCQTHAKAIDDDENRFPRRLLIGWRKHAEDLAAEELGRPIRAVTGRPIPGVVLFGAHGALIPHHIHLRSSLLATSGLLHKEIEQFLLDIGAPAAWANHYDAARLTLYELALNALRHGGAPEVDLKSSDGRVSLLDKGARFGLQDLLRSGRGGQAAVLALSRRAAGTLDLVYEWSNGQNVWSIVDEDRGARKNNPCGLDVGHLAGYGNNAVSRLLELDGCDEIHVYPPRLWSFSDFYDLYYRVGPSLRGRALVIHNVDPKSSFAETLLKDVPNVTFPDSGSRGFIKEG
jgi:hypothetical protein